MVSASKDKMGRERHNNSIPHFERPKQLGLRSVGCDTGLRFWNNKDLESKAFSAQALTECKWSVKLCSRFFLFLKAFALKAATSSNCCLSDSFRKSRMGVNGNH